MGVLVVFLHYKRGSLSGMDDMTLPPATAGLERETSRYVMLNGDKQYINLVTTVIECLKRKEEHHFFRKFTGVANQFQRDLSVIGVADEFQWNLSVTGAADKLRSLRSDLIPPECVEGNWPEQQIKLLIKVNEFNEPVSIDLVDKNKNIKLSLILERLMGSSETTIKVVRVGEITLPDQPLAGLRNSPETTIKVEREVEIILSDQTKISILIEGVDKVSIRNDINLTKEQFHELCWMIGRDYPVLKCFNVISDIFEDCNDGLSAPTDSAVSNLGDDIIKTIITCFPQLTELTLNDCAITDAGIEKLSEAFATSLKRLNLAVCDKLTDQSCKDISAMKNLESLDLSWSQVSNNGVAVLIQLQLEELNLSECDNITKECFNAINCMNMLRSLNIEFCQQIRKEDIHLLLNGSIVTYEDFGSL